MLIEDQWFASEAGATTPSPWHQDEPYYRLDRPFLTIWVTLDDIDEGGSLRVVPWFARTGERYAMVEFSATGRTIDPAGLGSPVPDVEADPERYDVRSWSLRAGDAIALSSRTLHATGPGALPRTVPAGVDPVGRIRRPGTSTAAAARRRSGTCSPTASSTATCSPATSSRSSAPAGSTIRG